MVIGTTPYGFIAKDYRKPFVVSGFEPLDILQSIWMLLKQMREGRAETENQYAHVVPDAGNAAAQAAVDRVYELREFFEWHGLGSIDEFGVRSHEAYTQFDAEQKFAVPNLKVVDPASTSSARC